MSAVFSWLNHPGSFIFPRPVLLCPALSCLVLLFSALPCLVLSRPVPYRAVPPPSHPILSHPVPYRTSNCSMMPLFIANFGSTLDELGEPVDETEETSILESVESFVVIFGIIGAVAGLAGFTMVSLWSIAGERQV